MIHSHHRSSRRAVLTLGFFATFFLTTATQSSAQQAGGTGSGTTGSGATGSGASGLRDPDEIFSDGVQRGGAAVQRQIGSAPGTTGTANTVTGGGRAGGGLFGGLGGLGGFGGFGGLGGLFGGNQQTQRSVRTRLVSKINPPIVSPVARQASIQTTFSQIAAKPRFTGIRVEMDGQTAVLTGDVANEDDKRMATLLVQLEPGVRDVRNELAVSP